MSRWLSCLFVTALLLGASGAQAADLERLWVWNLGESTAEVTLGSLRGAAVRVEAGEALEAPHPERSSGRITYSPRAELLLVRASRAFDASGLEIDTTGKPRQEIVAGRLQVRVDRPAWARELLVLEARDARLAAGESAEILALGDEDGSVRLAVGLGRDSAVTVTVVDRHGDVVHSLTASSTVPVRWRAELGFAAELDGGRLALRVDQGTAVAGVPAGEGAGRGLRLRSVTAASILGDAEFSQPITCSGDLDYTVTGGPPNTCGELNTFRNGSWLFAADWLCTNSSGYAKKGPWSWDATPSDQTDDTVFIRWPDGNTTDNTNHIWDKSSAVTHRDSPWGAPPTSYYGHATDTQWGTGFDFGGGCQSNFQNSNTVLWWDPATDTYSSSTIQWVTRTLSRVNRWYVNWSGPFPSPGSHVSGDTYWWTTCCTDSCGFGQCISESFSVP